MADIFSLDYESSSFADIRNVGAYRYAEDASTRILMFAIARNDEAPLMWRFDEKPTSGSLAAKAMFREAVKSGAPIYAHSAQFEHAMSRYRLKEDVGIDPPAIEQWRCTKVMALRAAIPASLDGASQFLKVAAKDKKGTMLIRIFSDRNKIITLYKGKEKIKTDSPIHLNPIPWDWKLTLDGDHNVTVREAWEMFIDYCRQDVVVEQQIHKKLTKFELEGTELEGFRFDLRMNDYGVPVNVGALEHAKSLIERNEERLVTMFEKITGLKPSQTAKVLEWLKAEGYPGDDLRADTMENYAKSDALSDTGRKALEIRSHLSFAAVKKIPTMLDTACSDGRMRGLFQFYGAQKTGRWTSGGPQLQNAKRPTIKNTDAAYADICAGVDIDDLSMFYGGPHEVIASCVRNFVQPHQGMMLDADYAGIESRMAAYLCGCERDLEMLRNGVDLYKDMASTIFGVPYDRVTKEQRFVGKVAVLSCCYSTSDRKLWETCTAWGQPVPKAVAIKAVKTFRESKSEYPKTWRAYGDALKSAMTTPGKWFDLTGGVKVGRSVTKPFDRLLIRLPSGRDIVHPMPELKRVVKKHTSFETGEVKEFETDELSFYGMNQMTKQWGRTSTYPASCMQSATQGAARDIMLNGCLNAQADGFRIFAVIHDQALADEGDYEKFVSSLCRLPKWLPDDFPLAAEGALVGFYSK